MNRPSDFESLYAEATKRSGRPDCVEYPAPAAGTSIVLCRLSDEDQRKFVDGACSSDEGIRETARAVALSAARLWPDQSTFLAACEAVPGLDKACMSQVERLGGGAVEFLRVVDVTKTMDDSVIASFGVDPGTIAALRKQYPHEEQLKIACYRDDDLEIAWSCVLRLPGDRATDLMLRDVNVRGNEAITTFAVNSVVWPEREQAASFVRGQYRIAYCLWPALFSWAQKAARQRPTIWRPKSQNSATSIPPQMSAVRSSPQSG
jgi:hypothetical protein